MALSAPANSKLRKLKFAAALTFFEAYAPVPLMVTLSEPITPLTPKAKFVGRDVLPLYSLLIFAVLTLRALGLIVSAPFTKLILVKLLLTLTCDEALML